MAHRAATHLAWGIAVSNWWRVPLKQKKAKGWMLAANVELIESNKTCGDKRWNRTWKWSN